MEQIYFTPRTPIFFFFLGGGKMGCFKMIRKKIFLGSPIFIELRTFKFRKYFRVLYLGNPGKRLLDCNNIGIVGNIGNILCTLATFYQHCNS